MALTDQQELEFRDTFSLFDRNGNDSIPSADLGTLLRTLGHFPSSEELRKMKDKYETSTDRTISWDGGAAGGFRELITARIKSSASPASIIDAFKVFDTIYTLTAGGPGTSTEVPSLLAYRMSFEQWRIGESAAFAVLVWIGFFVLCSLFYHVAKKKLNAF